ncbi:MAG TPA: glycosyl transferase family 1 [Candidatus Cybelea sp.]|nr:glycosyl transferase family 1 [Candidatus Cybelea sp.]
MLRILLLAHDLADDSVGKRVAMLACGGAEVTLAGFRRTPEPIGSVAGCAATDFGQTRDAAFGERIWAVARSLLRLPRYRALFEETDLIWARTLEMLAIAVRGQALCSVAPPIVYESLDIHRLLLRQDLAGAALREVEGRLGRSARLLVTSSPAFVSNYFATRSKVNLPVRLIENKVFIGKDDAPAALPRARPSGPPWVIGWFGHIRCKESLRILTDAVQRHPGKVEVVIRGRPAFDDFERSISQTPGMRFLGPYKNPEDLDAIYREAHFTWAIDMFEHGLNSAWLLPNRLYEGGLYGCVPIADASVETGRFLQRLGIGVTLEEPLAASLAAFLDDITPERYRALEEAAELVPRSTWLCEPTECTALVRDLASLTAERALVQPRVRSAT